jgi:GNAT superfamily N-acetyltransferase
MLLTTMSAVVDTERPTSGDRYNLAACEKLCIWTATSNAVVRPLWSLYHTCTESVIIEPWQCCKREVQQAVQAAWPALPTPEGGTAEPPSDLGIRWPGGTDVLYVAHTTREALVGFVAVDVRQFYPVISNLYVVEARRAQGHARMLLQQAERHITGELDHEKWWLWCPPGLQDLYRGMGYEPQTLGPAGSPLPDLGGHVLLCKGLLRRCVSPKETQEPLCLTTAGAFEACAASLD